jgi:hypothetical protein
MILNQYVKAFCGGMLLPESFFLSFYQGCFRFCNSRVHLKIPRFPRLLFC